MEGRSSRRGEPAMSDGYTRDELQRDALAARRAEEGRREDIRLAAQERSSQHDTDKPLRTPEEILATGVAWITEVELERLVRLLAETQQECDDASDKLR